MNKFIKKIVSVFLAACTFLPGSLCYAVKTKRHQNQRKAAGRGAAAAAAAASSADASALADEEELKALRAEIHLLISGTPAKCKLKLSESLKSKCQVIENTEQLQELFADFFVGFIESKGSVKSINEGTILFLSLINYFEQDPTFSSDHEKNFYWWLAFLALDMCTTLNAGLYDTWYNALLRQYKPPAIGDARRKFDTRQRDEWHRNLRILMSDRHRFDTVNKNMMNIIGRDINADLFAYLAVRMYMRVSPFLRAQHNAEMAMETLQFIQSTELVDEAKNALEQYRKELGSAEVVPGKLTLHARRNIEEMQKTLGLVEPSVFSAQGGFESLKPAHDSIMEMLSDISAESVAAAEKACEPSFKFVEEQNESIYILAIQNVVGSTVEYFKDALKWAKDYLNFIKPCMDSADRCVRILETEFSEENLARATEAQKAYEKALSEHPPTSEFIKSSLGRSLSIIMLMLDVFEGVRKHWQENEDKIVKIQTHHETLEKAEKLNLENQQRLEDWKKTVADRQQSKEEEQAKRCAAENMETLAQERTYEVVFLHDPRVSDPLKYLSEQSQNIEVWNTWYRGAKRGAPEGSIITRNPWFPIYKKMENLDLEMCQQNGRPAIYEYRGGGDTKNTQSGLRILFYREQVRNRIVVLYVGNPFGVEHCKKRWETLGITTEWIYEPVGEIPGGVQECTQKKVS